MDTHGSEKFVPTAFHQLLIDQYVSKQNALGTQYGTLAYLFGFSDYMELMAEPLHFSGVPRKPNE